MSLKKFLQSDYESAHYNNDFKVELVTLASDEQLKTIVKSIKVRLVTGKEWLDKYMELISGYDKPSYKLLKPYLFEGELIFESRELEIGSSEMEAFEKFKTLKEQMEATDTWCKRANKFLQTKNTSRVRQRSRNNNHDSTHASNGTSASLNDSCGSEIPLNEVSELVSLLREIPSLPVSAPEMDQLLTFAQEVSRFNGIALTVLQYYESNVDGERKSEADKLPSDVELESLYLLGESTGVQLNTFQLLDRILQRRRWLKEVSQYNVTVLNSESLLKLIEDGEKYSSLDDKALMDRLHKDYIDCVNANNQLLDAMGCGSGNKDGDGDVTEDETETNGSANVAETDGKKNSNGAANTGEKRIDMDLVTELFNKNVFLPIDPQVRETFHSLSHEFKIVSNQLDSVLELIYKRDELMKEFTVGDCSQDAGSKVCGSEEKEIDFNRLADVVDQIHDIACSTSVSGPGGNTTVTNLNNNGGPTIQQLHDIVNKSAKFSNLDAKIAILQPHLKLMEGWSTKLRSRFLQSHYPRSTKKLTNLFNEQLQRNDVIFNESWESENYCVCRLSHEDDMMVECESCQTWCHFKCIGLENESEVTTKFICPLCDLNSIAKTTNFVEDNLIKKKPQFAKLKKFTIESVLKMGLISDDLALLTKVIKRCCQFEQEFKNERGKLFLADEGDQECKWNLKLYYRKLVGVSVDFDNFRKQVRERLIELNTPSSEMLPSVSTVNDMK
ncbi:unnamed protein product [Ambrosiozyma monospora]|uniref:Unnamed protein product n=1 Tax=Ambrosiozyma monospora TaxID=43982 RepID=A0A9W6Z2R7_AMBMO|nr:unnamed protein product [Ambrosiozyma monospora]